MSLNRFPRRAGWRPRDIARDTIVVLAVYAACRFVYAAHTLIFVAFLGILLGLAVASGVDRLERWRVPRGVAACWLWTRRRKRPLSPWHTSASSPSRTICSSRSS